MDYKDYYKILGISKNADEKEIKKAYRKLARQYHPDVNPGDKAAEAKFKDINEANEALSDPEKRKLYDQFGSQYQQHQRSGGNPNDFWQQWGGSQQRSTRTMNPEDLQDIFGAGGASSFFESVFVAGRGQQRAGGFQQGGFGNFNQAQMAQKGRDIEQAIDLTIEEAFTGTTRALQFGDGRSIEVKIPQGVDTGSKVRIKGKGQPSYNGGQTGNLYLVVNILPHAQYERDGDNLTVTIPVDLYTAVLGGTVTVTAPDKTVKLTIPAGTENGKRIRLRGLGMPNIRDNEKRGDLYAKINVQIPQDLSDKEQELFSELQALRE